MCTKPAFTSIQEATKKKGVGVCVCVCEYVYLYLYLCVCVSLPFPLGVVPEVLGLRARDDLSSAREADGGERMQSQTGALNRERDRDRGKTEGKNRGIERRERQRGRHKKLKHLYTFFKYTTLHHTSHLLSHSGKVIGLQFM